MDGNGASYSIYPGLPFIDQTPKPDGSIDGKVTWSTKNGPVVTDVPVARDFGPPAQGMVDEVIGLVGVYSEQVDMKQLERDLSRARYAADARGLVEGIEGLPDFIKDQAYSAIDRYSKQGAFLPKPPEPRWNFYDKVFAQTFPRHTHPQKVVNNAIFDGRENSC